MNLTEFNKKALEIKKEFLSCVKSRVLIVTHRDCDGICSAYIMLKLLFKLNIAFDLKTYNYIDDKSIYEMSKKEYDCYIFLDLGSSYLDYISDAFSDKTVFVFDHHHIKGTPKNIKQLNLREFGIDSDLECCSSSLTYYFVKLFSEFDFSSLSIVAVLGAVGDYQMKEKISGLNKLACDDATNKGLLAVSKDLNIYGKESRYLHKALARCDFNIPGILNETDTMLFLKDIGIYKENKWKKYNELRSEEKKILEQEIIKKRTGDITGVYSNSVIFFPNGIKKESTEEKNSKNKEKKYDAYEYSTIINSCIRMDNEKEALLLCSFDENVIMHAKNNMDNYKIELKTSLEFIEKTQKYESDKVVIINVYDRLKPEIISTVSSIIAKSRKYDDGTLLFIIGRVNASESKISCRVCGLSKQNKINAKQILENTLIGITKNVGGHFEAAGAVIHTIDEEKVIEKLKSIKL